MRVVFLRHGESEYNIKELINVDPSIKVHLTSKGKKQSKEAAEKLESYKFDVILVSEFPRAKETVEIINESFEVPIFVDKRINEVKIGFEGKRDQEFLDIAWKKGLFSYKENGKESWNDTKKRVDAFLKELKTQNYDEVLVVSHQWIIRIVNQLLNKLSNEEAFKLPLGNCDFLEFDL